MKYLKTLGMTATTALVAVALIGTSSASATQSTAICNEASAALACPAGKLTTTLHGVATNPLLDTTSFIDVKCASSLFKASLLTLGNAPTAQTAHLEELSWTGCETHGGAGCLVHFLLRGLFSILKLNTKDAHVESDGGTTVLVECGMFFHCAYGGKPVLLAEDATGSAGADLKVNMTVPQDPAHVSAFCPQTSTLLALYISLTLVFIRK